MTDAADADHSSPGGVVEHYLAEQCSVITAADAPLREGAGSVHDTRVAIRRLRSTLRVFAAVFEPIPAARLERELSWYAGELGAVRDREVLALRLEDAVAALPAGLVLGPVSAQIGEHLHDELTYHRAALVRTMSGDRYRALLSDVSGWRRQAPYTSLVDERDGLLSLSSKAAAKARSRLASAPDAADPATALHRARKAAKRARYSAELVEPLDPDQAGQRIRHFKHVQTELGAYQDSVIAAELLRRLGAGAGTLPGHNGFTYGLLYQREVRAGQIARDTALAL